MESFGRGSRLDSVMLRSCWCWKDKLTKVCGFRCRKPWSDCSVETRALRGNASSVLRSLDHSFSRVSVSFRLMGNVCVKASRHAVDVDEKAFVHLTIICL